MRIPTEADKNALEHEPRYARVWKSRQSFVYNERCGIADAHILGHRIVVLRPPSPCAQLHFALVQYTQGETWDIVFVDNLLDELLEFGCQNASGRGCGVNFDSVCIMVQDDLGGVAGNSADEREEGSRPTTHDAEDVDEDHSTRSGVT